MVIGSTNVLNWYQTDFRVSVKLIDSFVSLMEKQVEESIHKYKTDKQEELVDENCGEDEGTHGQIVETYGGLDSMSWRFEAVFEEYFPSLQRRSAPLLFTAISNANCISSIFSFNVRKD